MSNNCFYIKFIYDYQSFFGKEISFFLKNIINDFEPFELFGYDKFDNSSYKIIEKEDFKFRSVLIYSDREEVVFQS